MAWVGHVWVDLMNLSVSSSLVSLFGIIGVKLTRPWARYVRRRCLGAWLTWMCLTTRLPVSRPLVSAFASAFLRRPSKNSADFTGHLARETPNCLPIHHKSCQHISLAGILLLLLQYPWVGRILTLRSATSSSSVSSHWDGLLVLLDVLEELYSALQFPSVDSLCCLSGVLEGDTQVRSTRTSGLRWVYLSGGVTDLRWIFISISGSISFLPLQFRGVAGPLRPSSLPLHRSTFPQYTILPARSWEFR